jgi:hypothetical protein
LSRPPLAEIRVEVVARLRMQAVEIEDAIRVRAFAVAELSGHEEPGYREGLRAAIGAAVGFALDALEGGEHRVGPLPPEVVTQARAAARSRVVLAIVLRRYAAGYSVLSDFLQRELRQGYLQCPEAFSALQQELTALFDRLVAEVSAEFEQESERLGTQSVTAVRIRRLLAGELVDLGDLGYRFDGWHLAVVAMGHAAEDQLGTLARGLDRRWLLDEFDGLVAVWIGGGERFDGSTLIAAISDFDGLSVGSAGPQRACPAGAALCVRPKPPSDSPAVDRGPWSTTPTWRSSPRPSKTTTFVGSWRPPISSPLHARETLARLFAGRSTPSSPPAGTRRRRRRLWGSQDRPSRAGFAPMRSTSADRSRVAVPRSVSPCGCSITAAASPGHTSPEARGPDAERSPPARRRPTGRPGLAGNRSSGR